MVYIPLLLALSCLPSLSLALDITGRVQWNSECPDIKTLRPSKVVLDNGRMKGSVQHDGGFSIPDVPVGTYVLSVISPDYAFDQLRIDVLDSISVPEVRPYVAGTPLNPPSTVLLPSPIILTPRQKHAYFVPHESFNLMAMLSNPMMLMMVVGGAMMLAMPYLMKNMDPEAMEEFKEQHAKSGLSAIMGGDEPSTAAAPVTNQPSSAIKNRGNKNRKR
ncbi:hypothetical protein FPV67DRAFT_1465276 [Lyophyllum atratum]|nr:hypothetical protein FPV67DRAFT_1465276 [Lyophyllum atratum]